MRKLNQNGFGLAEVLIIVVVVGALGYAGVSVSKQQQKNSNSPLVSQTEEASPLEKPDVPSDIRWGYDEARQKWFAAGGEPPACPDPIFTQSPVDTAKATSILAPGQYRGTDYKAHGGWRFDNSKSADIQVKVPMDAKLIGLVRYIEAGEIQYLLDFQHDCGIAYRFDHVFELTPKFLAVAEKTPEAKVDDTRGGPLAEYVEVKAGEVIATAIGHPKQNNAGMDFGVYDYRQPNTISKNPNWAALDVHKKFWALHAFGVCWYDWLPEPHAANTTKLGPADPRTKIVSDYCPNSPGGTTLQYSGGNPPRQ